MEILRLMGILLLIILVILIGSKVIYKNDFTVVTGEITLTNGTGNSQVNYPDGFTKDNCVVISASVEKQVGVAHTEGVNTTLFANIISISCKSEVGPSATRNYKIVLMKI